MSNERDELAAVMRAAIDRPKPGANLTILMADALLAAGYRKPRTITTVEELDALPVCSVVRSDMGVMWEKDVYTEDPDFPWWMSPGDSRQYPAWRISFPATVLHTPEPTQ